MSFAKVEDDNLEFYLGLKKIDSMLTIRVECRVGREE